LHPAPAAAARPPAWRDLAGDRSSAPPAPPRRRAETDLPECARAPRGARHTATPPPRRARGCGGRCRRSRWRGTARPAAPGPPAPPRTGRACRGVRPAAWRARDAPDRPRRETWVLRASRRAPRRRSARALLDLLEHGVDPLGVLDAAIELEAQLGAGAQAQLAGQLGAQERRGTAETLERLRLFLL